MPLAHACYSVIAGSPSISIVGGRFQVDAMQRDFKSLNTTTNIPLGVTCSSPRFLSEICWYFHTLMLNVVEGLNYPVTPYCL